MNKLQLPPIAERRHFVGHGKEALETGRNRLLVTAVVLTLAFSAIVVRLFDLSVLRGGEPVRSVRTFTEPKHRISRADVVDRNGVVLASSLPTASLYANPSEVGDPAAAAAAISGVFPEIDAGELANRLGKQGRFVWVKRNLTPEQQLAANRLGLPGFSFIDEERRIYPHGNLTAHLLGLTDVDGNGIAGIEQYFDQRLRHNSGPLTLAVDIRVQSILRSELAAAMTEFEAIGAAGVVMNADTGEAIAMVSLPDFDPNDRDSFNGDARFNRIAKGVYEMGSTFKLFTAAMALDTGTVDMAGGYDASEPIRISRFAITDYHAKKRWLSVPEIIVHSSNIGAAKMAVDVGTNGQRKYLGRFGLLRAASLEMPENAKPLMPLQWREINTMTIAFGHGIAVSPIQLVTGVAALVNGGLMHPATALRRFADAPMASERVISAETSNKMRQLMRLKGTGRNADAKGYYVGGKTGTAEKQVGGVYKKNAKISSFIGAFPIYDPKYIVFAMLDEPHGNKRTHNYATGGWVAAPVVSRVVQQMGPLLGVEPNLEGREPMVLPGIDGERTAPVRRLQPGLVKQASATSGLIRPVPGYSRTVDNPPPAPVKIKAALPPPPAGDTPDDRIARKTREALEQALVAR